MCKMFSVLRNQSCSPKDLCSSNPCFNNGTCMSSGASITCFCPQGYGGSLCQHDIDECSSQPCQHAGKCTEGINNFTCDCTGTGYQGKRSEGLHSKGSSIIQAHTSTTPGHFYRMESFKAIQIKYFNIRMSFKICVTLKVFLKFL